MKTTSKIKTASKMKMTSKNNLKNKNDLKNKDNLKKIIWPPPIKRILPEIFFYDLSLFCYNSIHVCMYICICVCEFSNSRVDHTIKIHLFSEVIDPPPAPNHAFLHRVGDNEQKVYPNFSYMFSQNIV